MKFRLDKPTFSGLYPLVIFLYIKCSVTSLAYGVSTDPRLCGGYHRESTGYIDFRFNENTAPPGIASKNKFCMWTIMPSIPTERYRSNMTIRNVNLDCDAGDYITINYFNEDSTTPTLGEAQATGNDNPLCPKPNEVWTRENANGVTMVVILYVKDITYGNGFYLEWEPGFDTYIPNPGIVRTPYHTFGRPSMDPDPYFAAGFISNQIATFGFIKANYSEGYAMSIQFTQVSDCEGQEGWQECFPKNNITICQVEDDGQLKALKTFKGNSTGADASWSNKNGFFIIVRTENKFGAGGRFKLLYDTVRG